MQFNITSPRSLADIALPLPELARLFAALESSDAGETQAAWLAVKREMMVLGESGTVRWAYPELRTAPAFKSWDEREK